MLSHPQALTQYARFLGTLTGVELVAHEDTAAAADEVGRAGDPTQGAIASAEAAQLYGLQVLQEGVADHEENRTRFVVVSALQIDLDPRIPATTSLVFKTAHHQSALAECLPPFRAWFEPDQLGVAAAAEPPVGVSLLAFPSTPLDPATCDNC